VRKKIEADLKKIIIIFLCVDFFLLQVTVILIVDRKRKKGKVTSDPPTFSIDNSI